MKILKCEKCGKMVAVLKKSPCDTFCCGEPMTELTANTTEAAFEKHIPAVTVDGNLVNVKVSGKVTSKLGGPFEVVEERASTAKYCPGLSAGTCCGRKSTTHTGLSSRRSVRPDASYRMFIRVYVDLATMYYDN